MFDICSDRLMDCEERFAGRNGHRFVEIWDCGNGQQATYRSGDLKEKEINSWVHEDRCANGPIQSGLRVLLSPKPSGKPSSGKLPFSRQTFFSLSEAWRIPSTFLRAISQKLSVVTECSVSRKSSGSGSSPTRSVFPHDQDTKRESKISDEAQCLLIRGDVDWTWDYTLLLTVDPQTHTTYVLIVGLTAVEIDLVQSYLASLAATCSEKLSTHPLLIPTVLLDLATDDTASLLKLRTKLLNQIQQRTGMDRFNSLKSATIEGRKSTSGKETGRQELDLDAVMLRLTCLSDWVAAQRGFIGLQRRVVEVVQNMMDEMSAINGAVLAGHTFQERLSFVKESLLAAEQKCQYLERSIGAQVQTIYSLIGQKDNRLNISATSASCQIASDSRRIAILTRRDSTDMRIIAAVTLIFLPGTFVATVFSTGMFDWGNGDPTPNPNADEGGSGKMVSRYIWVYFMLTGILTFLVLVGWILFSWFQNRRMMKQFHLDPEQGGEVAFESERKCTESSLVEGGQQRSRSWALREFERWKLEARGTLSWGRGKKDKGIIPSTDDLKCA